MPGEGALARRAQQLRDGVALAPSVMPALTPWAQRFGVTLLTPIAETTSC